MLSVQNSSNKRQAKESPKANSRLDSFTYTDASSKLKSPKNQDSYNRPMKNSHAEFSPKSDSLKFTYSMSDSKARPQTARDHHQIVDNSSVFATSKHFVFPEQGNIDDNLKEGLIALKLVIREYEEKQKEKKALQTVVDQLKQQTNALKAKKGTFTVNFEKINKDTRDMNESTINKSNQRKVIDKSLTQVRDEVINHNSEIQESIGQNVEIARLIQEEQDMILKIQEQISEMKQIIPIITKEKDKLRNDLMISGKLLKTTEEKYANAVREKASYMEKIDYSHSLKK